MEHEAQEQRRKPIDSENEKNTFSESLPPELQSFIDKIDQKDKSGIQMAISRFVSNQINYSGPIPHPDLLLGYEKVIPGSADRILIMAEKQSNHRIEIEKYVIENQQKQSRLGQIFAFILAIIGLSIGTILAILGRELVASIIFGTTILGLVAVFISGKQYQRKNISEKS